MNELKRMLQDLENNAELKKAVEDAQLEVKSVASPDGKLSQENVDVYQDAIISAANKFGYTITKADFVGGDEEGELDEGDLAAVAGGNGFCLLSSCGCMVVGEIDNKGGCILVGYWHD